MICQDLPEERVQSMHGLWCILRASPSSNSSSRRFEINFFPLSDATFVETHCMRGSCCQKSVLLSDSSFESCVRRRLPKTFMGLEKRNAPPHVVCIKNGHAFQLFVLWSLEFGKP